MLVNLIITLAGLVLLIFFSYQGFKAGEMGVMVGIFSVVGVLFNAGVAVLLYFIIRGLHRMRRSAVIGALVFTVTGILGSFPILSLGSLPFLIILAYMVFTLVVEILCLRRIPAVPAG